MPKFPAKRAVVCQIRAEDKLNFLGRVEKVIKELKHPPGDGEMRRIPISLDGSTILYLRPVPAEIRGETSLDARHMTDWRNNNKSAFFTWFTATEESTGKWLRDCYGPDGQDIMFMVEDSSKEPFGHLALYNFDGGDSSCELGRVLRGVPIGPKRGMTLATLALLNWAVSDLIVKKVFLDVFQDNKKAITLYERLEFQVTETLALRRLDSSGTTWEKISKDQTGDVPDGFALRMEVTAERLAKIIRSELTSG